MLASALLGLGAVASASAINVTGTWQMVGHCTSGACAGKEFSETLTLTQAQGSSTVSGSGTRQASITGTLSGDTLSVTTHARVSGVVTTATVTFSASGQAFSGTYQTNNGESGTINGTREGTPPAEGQKLLASATQVLCNLQVSLSSFTCAVEVGDASVQTPAKMPTGSVNFTATAGGFVGAGTCTLAPTTGSPSVSSCSVTYLPPSSGIPTGTPAPVSASYSGDNVFASSTGLPGAGAGISPRVATATPGPGEASTTVSCPAGAQSCPINANLSVVQTGQAVTAQQGAAGRVVRIGSSAVTLKAGQRRSIKVTLNRLGRKLLASHKHLVALLAVSSGGVLIKTQKVQIKPLRGRR